MLTTKSRFVLPFLLLLAANCGSNNVSSEDDARRAYLGLDGSIDKAIDLGFDGFNAAQSANIPMENAVGAIGGMIAVNGQVDQGVSANKQMRLNITMSGYADVRGFTYDTGELADGSVALPALDLSLQGIPNGTLSGTLAGTFRMSGDLSGPVALKLMITGDLAPNPDGGSKTVVRKPGSTHVTGTATSPAGTFSVDVTK
jgi:hypothetical protein